MKKLIYSVLAVFMGASILAVGFTEKTYANCNSTFFGIPSWCRGLEEGGRFPLLESKTQEGIAKFTWTVVGNLADGAFRIIGVISMAFIIWGGYQYMLAMGDSGKLGKAKTAITNAIIGLVISIGASTIVSFVLGVF